jgi:hypothetical protein
MLETAIAPVEAADVEADSDTGVWIEALPARVYSTPQYGEVPVPVDKLQRMITNFKGNVRGQEVATDFEHGLDSTKGLQASGWYRDFDIRPSSDDPTQMSLYAKVEFTDDAKKDIKDKKYKYFSLEWDDDYETDNHTFVPDVVIGGGLTNRPIAKRTMPINFSETLWNELDEDTQKAFAVWSTAYKNALPNSAFLYSKGKERHLPYRDATGKIDLPHLRNAISRLSQKATGSVGGQSWLTDSVRASLLARARKLLGGQNKASELAAHIPADVHDEAVRGQVQILLSEAAAWEHSDPGLAVPLYASADGQPDPGVGINVPRITGDVAQTDPAIAGGWRRDPLPVLNPDQTEPQDIQESREGTNVEMSEVRTFAASDTDEPHLQTAINELQAYITAEKAESEANNASDIKKANDLLGSLKALLAEEVQEEPAEAQKTMAEVIRFAQKIAKTAKGGKNKLSASKVELSDEQVIELVGLVEVETGSEAETDPTKFMESAKKQFTELSEFKKNVGQSQQERQFSEQFPDVWREHQALLESNRVTASRSFSESVSRINSVKATGEDGTVTYEPTRNGLSGLALETVAEMHKKFSEGTGTLADFESTVKAIVNGGIVEFGEVGSSTDKEIHDVDSTTATGIAAARKLFAEKVAEVQTETKDGKQQFSEYSAAIAEAAKRYPDLAEAYRATAA